MEQKKRLEQESLWQKSLLDCLHDMIRILAVVLLLFVFVVRIVVVSGPSMYRTLHNGDYLLVLSNVFCGDPKPGNIVVASKESFRGGEDIVKRVIATEGQTVDIDFQQGIVYVDGVALEEPYTNTPTTLPEGMTFPLVVDEGCVFLMGDNRNVSLDSRSTEIGLVDCREIVGRVFFLLLPGDSPEDPRDWSRIGGLF